MDSVLLQNICFISKFSDKFQDFLQALNSEKDTLIDNESVIELDLKNHTYLKSIPMMMRRRLNLAGRFACGLALNALNKENDIESIVFASSVGETLRCITLLKEIILDKGVSPTEFSSSVHNSNVGVTSIISKFKGDTIAISTKKDVLLGNALVESFSLLFGQNKKKVLLVIYEEEIAHESISVPESENDHGIKAPFALSFLLSRNEDTHNSKDISNDIKENISESTDAQSVVITKDNLFKIKNLKDFASYIKNSEK